MSDISTLPPSAVSEETTPIRPFVRAIEIWVPTSDRSKLELADGYYGALTAFEEHSQDFTFAYDEGLPGKAWAAGHPIILKDLVTSYFKRGEAAAAEGLTCGVAIPIFSADELNAVLVLFCGEDAEHVGAVELWRTPEESNEMGLVDGYFGTATMFEFQSKHVKFMKGFGLPGLVWDSAMPVIMNDLGITRRFLRHESALQAGITRGLGIPVAKDGDTPWVLTFLTALGTPIALRFECWVPDEEKKALTFNSGVCEKNQDLSAKLKDAAIEEGAGTLGTVWKTGVPALTTDFTAEPVPIKSSCAENGFTTLIALPVISDAKVKAVVAWYI